MRSSRIYRLGATVLGVVLAGGCNSLDVPDLNNPSLEDYIDNPSAAKIATQATGLLIGHRAVVAGRAGYVSELGILGRESYNFDAADPRFVTELLVGPLNSGNGAFGGNHWVGPYTNLRNADILLQSVDATTDLSAEDKAATTGYAKTMEALDLLFVVNTRYTNGGVVTFAAPTDDPAPLVDDATVWSTITQGLDEGLTALMAGGAAFPFPLSSGFVGFDTPATFVDFNRALRARVAILTGDWNGALTALNQTFIDTSATADLDAGVYNVFSTGSGDVLNNLYDPSTTPDILGHPSLRTDTQFQADGVTRDDRFVRKTDSIAERTTSGLSSDIAFKIYDSNTAPIPIIRNEELILLRAEANAQLNNLTDALADVNYIRVHSGKLPALTSFASQAAAIDEILYNRRYSLMFEQGVRWIDARRYGRLDQLPKQLASENIFDRFPIPQTECDARDPKPAVCQ
jgi:starch-binding outer membrane protein, SusD/RagB family